MLFSVRDSEESVMSDAPFRSGLLVFPNLTQLDLTGPYEILARLPGSEIRLIWKTRDPVRSEHGLTILPDASFDDCGRLDLVLVPAGRGSTRSSKTRRRCASCAGPPPSRGTSSGSAPGRWCSARPDCCAAGAPGRTGCRAICWPCSARCRSPNGS
jgi:hypothetical protein